MSTTGAGPVDSKQETPRMSDRTHLGLRPVWTRLVALVLVLALTGGLLGACGGGAAAGAIVGAVAGAAIGSTFDDPYGCCYDDPYYYAPDPVAHDDNW